jgi:hypothetical protein
MDTRWADAVNMLRDPKGEDPRRIHGRRHQQANEFTREMKRCLLDAAEEAGNRLVAISNARLPKQPSKEFTKELIDLLRQEPNGMTSYFMWLAERHPAIFCFHRARHCRARTAISAERRDNAQ